MLSESLTAVAICESVRLRLLALALPASNGICAVSSSSSKSTATELLGMSKRSESQIFWAPRHTSLPSNRLGCRTLFSVVSSDFVYRPSHKTRALTPRPFVSPLVCSHHFPSLRGSFPPSATMFQVLQHREQEAQCTRSDLQRHSPFVRACS